MTRTDRSTAATDVLPAGVGLTKFRDRLRIPPVLRPTPTQQTKVSMRAVQTKLHSELPPTRVWAYDGLFPGPTIEVRRGQRLRVGWHNEVTGSYPVCQPSSRRRSSG